MSTVDDARHEAEWLLEKFAQDPTDWSTIDLVRLLDLWGIVGERTVTTESGWTVKIRYHLEHPDLNLRCPDTDPVHPATVLHVVRLIGTLRQRRGE